ncbi:hypothetical protein [Caldimonas tepidiphila]|uniref:hypothetical protein n=1 Tax=Caldimonas tepidiphila TaxID=2315841 RepID=UPI000E5A885F|nr:hypothetical protein [Caldimonas tepidiphila]
MSLLNHALSAAQARPPGAAARPARIAVLIGAGGALGSAVLEQALACGDFARVRAVVTTPVAPALRGFESATLAELQAGGAAHAPDTALIVFDRERHANGRDAAFLRPEPQQLPGLARTLRDAGVRHLLVVLPHVAASLPTALKHGLASLDEQAVAALDFEHLVIVRSAQPPRTVRGSRLERLAAWMLTQLHLMVPQGDQPVRAVKVASFVVQLARRLPLARRGTRVVPPEVVWRGAQDDAVAAVVHAWLHDEAMPPLRTPARRPPRALGGRPPEA